MLVRITGLVVLLAGAVVAGCGTAPSERAVRPVPARESALPSAPPLAGVGVLATDELTWGVEMFHFLAEDGSVVDRAPWAACLGNGCWDGAPHLAGPIPSVGSPGSLYFAFAAHGWDFEHVSFNPVDDVCGGRVIEVPAVKVGDRLFRIDPAGVSGRWRVDVFGYGDAGGDAVASVLWSTPVDGTMPVPTATGSLFTDEDGRRTSPYGGPEIHLRDLATTPKVAHGVWTASDESGASVSVPLTRTDARCAPAGTVSLTGAGLTPEQLASLGGRRVTYSVELRLDGQRFVGAATWPADQLPDQAPYTAFAFDPPLPAYTG